MIKVGVFGSAGRMGSQVVQAVTDADDMEFVGGVDDGDSRDALTGADVIVDFTRPDAVMDNLAWAIDHDISVVVGTTGFTEERYEQLRAHLAEHPHTGAVVAPNFGIGAVLMMHFAKQAARFYESAEIVELHHPNKVDAPSGTARTTAAQIAQARADAGLGPVPDATAQQEPELAEPTSTVSMCTGCGCAAWWPIRRCSSDRRARPSPSATTRWIAPRSCPVSWWRCGPCRIVPA